MPTAFDGVKSAARTDDDPKPMGPITPSPARSARRRTIFRTLRGIGVLTGLVTLAGATGGGRTARAAGFDLDVFKPATASTGFLCADSGNVLPARAVDVGMTLGYAHQPLVRSDQKTGLSTGDVVSDRVTGYLTAIVGVTDRINVGLRMPTVLHQAGNVDIAVGDETTGTLIRPRTPAAGDIDLLARARLLNGTNGTTLGKLHLTLTTAIGLPTGATDALAGNGGFSFRPRLVAGWDIDRFSAALSAGYEFRSSTEVPSSNLVVGNAATAGAGVAWSAISNRLWIMGEASLSVGMAQTQTGNFAVPAEAIAGARVAIADLFVVQGGVGTGLNRAPGSPRFTGLVTVSRVWGGP
jgi:hypothetical protein